MRMTPSTAASSNACNSSSSLEADMEVRGLCLRGRRGVSRYVPQSPRWRSRARERLPASAPRAEVNGGCGLPHSRLGGVSAAMTRVTLTRNLILLAMTFLPPPAAGAPPDWAAQPEVQRRLAAGEVV